MWRRFVSTLRCPLCAGSLHVHAHEVVESSPVAPEYSAQAQSALREDPGFLAWIETGALSCGDCHAWYPIAAGLPVMLPYTIAAHDEFTRRYPDLIAKLPATAKLPDSTPPAGEHLVQQSFGTEWTEYDYDGVIWEMSYADHETRFLKEIGDITPNPAGKFLEVGCGIGLTTNMAQKNLGGEAVGVDLSVAAARATANFRSNPFLHFVQASLFRLPFAEGAFDRVYTRGVIHHTYSTQDAFDSVARFCRRGGQLYVWVYGPGSIGETLLRRVLYGSEIVIRWVLNRTPSWVSSVVLAPLALAYVVFNRLRRLGDNTIQSYNFRRALHAARDRYTPEFAHRTAPDQLRDWFQKDGFGDVQVVDWRVMPTADHDDYRRNVGVRGVRRSFVGAAPAVRESSRRHAAA